MKIKQVTGVFNVGVRYNGFEAWSEEQSELVEMACVFAQTDLAYLETEQYDFHLFTDNGKFLGEFSVEGGM